MRGDESGKRNRIPHKSTDFSLESFSNWCNSHLTLIITSSFCQTIASMYHPVFFFWCACFVFFFPLRKQRTTPLHTRTTSTHRTHTHAYKQTRRNPFQGMCAVVCVCLCGNFVRSFHRLIHMLLLHLPMFFLLSSLLLFFSSHSPNYHPIQIIISESLQTCAFLRSQSPKRLSCHEHLLAHHVSRHSPHLLLLIT